MKVVLRAVLAVTIIVIFASVTYSFDEVVRQKNVATRLVFPIVDVNGAVVTNAANLDSEYADWSDANSPGTWADLTGEAAEWNSSGWYSLAISQAEINYDYIAVRIKTTTTGAVNQFFVIRTTPLTNTALSNMSTVFDVNWTESWDNTLKMWNVDIENIGGEDFNDVLASAEEIADTTNDTIIAGAVQSNINEILADTGTTLPALIGTPIDTDLVTDVDNISANVLTETVADNPTEGTMAWYLRLIKAIFGGM